MTHWKDDSNSGSHESIIARFVTQSSGLDLEEQSGKLEIRQKTDGKVLSFEAHEIDEVIQRLDSDGQSFLQINFLNGHKILLTEKLIGFKPAKCAGLEMDKLPKVVTTPDLVSVVEAIEESLSTEGTHPIELDVLKKVFDSVLEGGEAVGFDLSSERAWLKRLAPLRNKATA